MLARREEPKERQRGRLWTVLVHGVAFLVFACLLRLESSKVLSFGGWPLRLSSIISSLGTLLVFEAALLLVARSGWPRSRRAWLVGLGGLHLSAHGALLIDHQFRLETGVELSLETVVLGLKQMGTFGGMLQSALDDRFPWRVAQALGCLAFAVFVGGRVPTLGPALFRRRFGLEASVALFAGGLFLVGGAVAWFGARGDEPPLRASTRAGLALVPSGGGEAGWTYERPRLVGSVGAARRPNIVLIVLESTRADVLGAYRPAGEATITPELDALAKRAIVFDDAYTAVTHTSKALVGLLCGGYPRLEAEVKESNAGGNPLACLPRLLGQLGYRSRFMQSAAGGLDDFPGLVRNMGFGSWMMREHLGGRGFQAVTGLGMDEYAMMEPALEWVGGEEPFFLTVLTSVAHYPYESPGVVPLEGRENAFENYRRAVGYVDGFVGDLVRQVQGRAQGETLFLLTADHGQAFGEHGVRVHDEVPYQEGTRVPLMAFGPEWLGQSRRVQGLRQHLDLLPTVLELLGARWEGRLPGRSLLASEGHERVITSCYGTRRCVSMRAGDLKFIYRYDSRPTEVYDLAHDPLEKRNLAGAIPRASLRAVEGQLEAMEASVERFFEEADARRLAAAGRGWPAERFSGPGAGTPARVDERSPARASVLEMPEEEQPGMP